MPNNNPGGSNAFGNYTLQPGYGDVAAQTALTREAPMSGSPIAANAIGAPRRAGRAAKSGRPASVGRGVAAPGAAGAMTPAAPPSPSAVAAQVWQAIAATPGASPLVLQYAQQAANGG